MATLWREINEIPSSKKDLKSFGLTLAAAFSLLSVFFWWKAKEFPWVIFPLAFFFLFFGLLRPSFLKAPHKIWMTLALLLGWAMSRVLLTVVFYLVLMPIGLFLRWTGKDILKMNWERKEESYWRPCAKRDKLSYTNQF